MARGAGNKLIPAITMAHESYTTARKCGLTSAEALQMARVLAPGHVLSKKPRNHEFSDTEIQSGVCECNGCRDLRDPSRLRRNKSGV